MPVEHGSQTQSGRLRLGMVGGGPCAFIGAVHRTAARLDDRYELLAAALSSDPERSLADAKDLHIPPIVILRSFMPRFRKGQRLFQSRASVTTTLKGRKSLQMITSGMKTPCVRGMAPVSTNGKVKQAVAIPFVWQAGPAVQIGAGRRGRTHLPSGKCHRLS
jgi:hypothetical protein